MCVRARARLPSSQMAPDVHHVRVVGGHTYQMPTLKTLDYWTDP